MVSQIGSETGIREKNPIPMMMLASVKILCPRNINDAVNALAVILKSVEILMAYM